MSGILSAIPEAWRDRAVYLLSGGLAASLGIGWGGLYRDDPFYGYEGDRLAERITELEQHTKERLDRIEGKLPNNFPPLDWAIWRASADARMNLIESEDQHVKNRVTNVIDKCESHQVESEGWKRRIQINEQWVEYFKKIVNNGTRP